MAHSNQVREFVMSEAGINLLAPYLGENGALTGSARRFEEARVRRRETERRANAAALQQQVQQRRRRAEAQIAALRADLEADEAELRRLMGAEEDFQRTASADLAEMAASRRT
jgi:circadian clock protein KaiC